MIITKLNEVCPEKKRKISIDDKPWFTEQLRILKRKKTRLFRKNRNSEKYKKISKIYEKKVLESKKLFKIKAIDQVMEAKGQPIVFKTKANSKLCQGRV